MRRAARFLIVLLAGMALLALAGYLVVTRITRDWFEADLDLRSRLAVASAREGLASNWVVGSPRLTATLVDITRDERILGAAACTTDGQLLTATEGYPAEFSCASVLTHMKADAPRGTKTWAMTAQQPGGPMHLSVTALDYAKKPLGSVILVHDLSFVHRREATTRNLLFGAFVIMALSISIVTLIASRLAWRGWTTELRRALMGSATTEFQPLVRDVRSLAERLANEREREARAGRWSPERLRSTLTQYLQGERVVILANREPYIHDRGPEGIRVLHPASGLVSALEPVMRACSGVWVAHGSGTADRETVDSKDRVLVPPGEEIILGATGMAERRRREWLLLRLFERGAVASVSRRAHSPVVSR